MPVDTLVHSTLLFALGFYAVVLIGLLVGLSRLQYHKTSARPFVSVIVAARNEETAIGPLLTTLLSQKYDTYEVIIVDDRSSDGTANIVKQFRSNSDKIRLVQVPSAHTELPAKKNALTQGILASKGEILCFTDADCIPPPGWIASLVSVFDADVGMVAGYSPYDDSLLPQQSRSFMGSVLQYFITYEELKGGIWSAGAIGLNRGWLCTGRNLAYRRSVWDEVGGFHEIRHSISGDDDLFLQLLRTRTKQKVRYVADPENHVPTIPPASFSAFVEQRIRHFSAGRFFALPMKMFFFLFHSSNTLLLSGLFIGLFVPNSFLSGVWFVCIKLLLDGILFLRASALFATKFPVWFVPMEFLYILYNAMIGPLGFIKSFEWKPETKS